MTTTTRDNTRQEKVKLISISRVTPISILEICPYKSKAKPTNKTLTMSAAAIRQMDCMDECRMMFLYVLKSRNPIALENKLKRAISTKEVDWNV